MAGSYLRLSNFVKITKAKIAKSQGYRILMYLPIGTLVPTWVGRYCKNEKKVGRYLKKNVKFDNLPKYRSNTFKVYAQRVPTQCSIPGKIQRHDLYENNFSFHFGLSNFDISDHLLSNRKLWSLAIFGSEAGH